MLKNQNQNDPNVWVHHSQTIRHNDPVKCASISAMHGHDVIGRVVQVRVGCGQHGSDLVFLRFPDNSLETVENEWFNKLEEDEVNFPPWEEDTVESTYTIKHAWPEVGFIVNKPAQPQTPGGAFSLIVTEDAVKICLP